MTLELALKDICIRRGTRTLIAALNVVWKSGDFVQIEGENGIGKTSLLRVIAGLAMPVTGKVYWQGEEIHQQREIYTENLLYLGHLSGIKPELTPWENLKFYQQVTPCKTGNDILWEVLDKVGLLGYEDLPAGELSAGQQKRIALARLWLSKAPLWLLDEPFTAIDRQGVENLVTLFENQIAKGGIVLLTSHQEISSHRLRYLNLKNYQFWGDE